MHEIGLFNDLALVLLCAALVSLIFVRLKWPVFLGYIVSGLLVGPNFLASSPISDLHNVEQLSQLGIIFLMFYIGMEFDLKRMRQALLPALTAVIIQTALFIFIGLQIAPVFNQGSMFGLFLGCLLAISSSMVTISILRDLKSLDTPHGQMAVGILIFEDILAITMLVVLSSVAVSSQVNFSEISQVAFYILVFVVGVFYLGKLLSPRAINFLARQGSEELITLCAVAFALAISLLALKFHFSEALGAFLAGSILTHSKLIKKIEHAVDPLRSVFTAVFFVSVGILIQPALILEEWKIILAMGLMVVAAKTVSVFIGLLLAGQKVDSSFRTAVVKSQIGEFSFIIVALAINLKVADPSFMTIAVGVSVLSSIISQLLAANVDTLINHTAKKMPRLLVSFHRYYETLFEGIRLRLDRNALFGMIKQPLLYIIFYAVLMTGLMLCLHFLSEFINESETFARYRSWLALSIWLLAALALLPLGSAVIRHINTLVVLLTKAVFANIAIFNQIEKRFLLLVNTAVSVGVVTVLAAYYFSIAAPYMPSGTPVAAFVIVSSGALLFLWQRIKLLDSRMESLFLESFEKQLDKEEIERQRYVADIASKYPWPVEVKEIEIPPDSASCGKKIINLQLRSQTGAIIIGISRQDFVQYNPGVDTMIFPHDHLFLFGNDEQIKEASDLLLAREKAEAAVETNIEEISIDTIYVGLDSQLCQKNLVSSRLRELYGITVLGIQRGEQQITSPPPYFIFESGDIVYVFGNSSVARELDSSSKHLAGLPVEN